jgi:hypothetical protein
LKGRWRKIRRRREHTPPADPGARPTSPLVAKRRPRCTHRGHPLSNLTPHPLSEFGEGERRRSAVPRSSVGIDFGRAASIDGRRPSGSSRRSPGSLLRLVAKKDRRLRGDDRGHVRSTKLPALPPSRSASPLAQRAPSRSVSPRRSRVPSRSVSPGQRPVPSPKACPLAEDLTSQQLSARAADRAERD